MQLRRGWDNRGSAAVMKQQQQQEEEEMRSLSVERQEQPAAKGQIGMGQISITVASSSRSSSKSCNSHSSRSSTWEQQQLDAVGQAWSAVPAPRWGGFPPPAPWVATLSLEQLVTAAAAAKQHQQLPCCRSGQDYYQPGRQAGSRQAGSRQPGRQAAWQAGRQQPVVGSTTRYDSTPTVNSPTSS